MNTEIVCPPERKGTDYEKGFEDVVTKQPIQSYPQSDLYMRGWQDTRRKIFIMGRRQR